MALEASAQKIFVWRRRWAASMERAIGETALSLESQMISLAAT
jgi:hypothetical protein